ncbi:MAG: YfcE family phosphodiesterase [Desulfobacteraceae bacterium]|nr:metallophosphoesterase family protein [Desulfobacteraceae bacterium]MBC2757906.1 YfcE family phosphodiesterase [Desulfobacteraceae bacterium]
MIVIGLTDIHGDSAIIEDMGDILAKADVALLVGDITNFGKEAETCKVLSPVIQRARKVFAVSGNCDYREVDSYLDAQKVNLHGRGVVYNGIAFLGLGGSLVTPFQTPNELTEDEIEHYLDQGYSQIPSGIPLVLVSHQPPVETRCDRISSGEHVGSIAVRRFIEKHCPVVCFTGHIHESTGIDRVGNTHIINPGMLTRRYYAYTNIDENRETFEVRGF